MRKEKIDLTAGNKNELTKRECEILRLLAKGMSRNEIAARLFVSPETVKKHLQNAYRKLKAKNKIEALRKLRWLDNLM
jgi:DNA-binding NarL/FixJ family response regulator